MKTTCHRAPILVILIIALAASTATAITRIDIPERQLEKNGRALVLSGDLSSHSGNGAARGVNGSAVGAMTSHAGRNLYLLKASGAYAEFETAVTASDSFGHFRHQYRILPWLFTDAFVQAQQDRFRRLQIRTLEGIGAAFLMKKTERIVLRSGTGIMHELERYRAGAGPTKSDTFRFTGYISLKAMLADRVTGTIIAYVQPRLSDPGDIRLLEESSLKVGINSWLALNLGFAVAYDGVPPAGVKKTDVDVTSGLTITL